MQDANKIFVETPQATLDPGLMPVLPGVQQLNVFEDIEAFITDDLITPIIGIGTGIITSVVEPIGVSLGEVGGIVGTTVTTVAEPVVDLAGDVVGIGTGIISTPLLIIGGIILVIILVSRGGG